MGEEQQGFETIMLCVCVCVCLLLQLAVALHETLYEKAIAGHPNATGML